MSSSLINNDNTLWLDTRRKTVSRFKILNEFFIMKLKVYNKANKKTYACDKILKVGVVTNQLCSFQK